MRVTNVALFLLIHEGTLNLLFLWSVQLPLLYIRLSLVARGFRSVYAGKVLIEGSFLLPKGPTGRLKSRQ